MSGTLDLVSMEKGTDSSYHYSFMLVVVVDVTKALLACCPDLVVLRTMDGHIALL
jgi:hypothetical protein